ncbi:alpha/beta fold hydrolase [Nocardia seriolae]|uniref:Alpha/beta hydrolase n=1 Tax=Nocardia seriolae TaxID=37332 RepID=A0ABC9Z084_9NOCA|nr:alpha/beta hydrolase [Nocardia seriolae]APA97917.1 Putative non-heme bromoperoxidase [Nocardia seriolae]OJF79915.1 alpha/beta hydrolase [Nocardia seriolae]QOW36145.1 alpha/beta hydrolase [Nocardia seriolae]QUN16354.1 alpha/beta hydrolase [Nocardia seriolae]WNJ56589.1 alpha/beta hydrolase [Nocardia seriolae]
MPLATLNGISLNYDVTGNGPLVVLIMGTGSPGRVWRTYQVPALFKAGFRVATFDNRGISPSAESAHGMRIEDLVADTAALIEHLGGPAYVVGTSMGARVTQELALARPELVRKAVMLATTGRPHPLASTLNKGERALAEQGVKLPPEYAAAIKAILNMSPHTLEADDSAQQWLDIFEYSASSATAPGVLAQLRMDRSGNRLDAYKRITVPSLVVGFADDRMLPPVFGREVADAIPGARFVELDKCGHYGYLERPDEVNRTIIDFLNA